MILVSSWLMRLRKLFEKAIHAIPAKSMKIVSPGQERSTITSDSAFSLSEEQMVDPLKGVDMQRFFSIVRSLFSGSMSQAQVDGINLILGVCRDEELSRQATAYCLATSFHETGRRMQPVREGFASTDKGAVKAVTRLYQKGRISTNYALPDPQTGESYFGRGHVQLTWKTNYRKMGEELGYDLVRHPHLALVPNISAHILVRGMKKGLFTGVSLDDVSEPLTSEPDFTNDRKVVNGYDRAEKIAQYADVFYDALEPTTA